MFQKLQFSDKSLAAAVAFALTLSLLLSSTKEAVAADCEIKACIEVYIQDGRIVIEGRKGKGPSSSTSTIPAPAPKPKLSKKPKPVVKKVLPAPTVKKKKKTSDPTTDSIPH